MSEDQEARRLAEQRHDDLARASERERQRAYERGQREAREDAHTAEQDRHLAEINGHVADMHGALEKVESRLALIEGEFRQFAAVAKAIEAKGVSTRTFILGVLALALPILTLAVTLASSGHL